MKLPRYHKSTAEAKFVDISTLAQSICVFIEQNPPCVLRDRNST